MNSTDNTPKWLLAPQFNKSKIARNVGISGTLMHMKIKQADERFTTSQLEDLEKERIRLLIMLATN